MLLKFNRLKIIIIIIIIIYLKFLMMNQLIKFLCKFTKNFDGKNGKKMAKW